MNVRKTPFYESGVASDSPTQVHCLADEGACPPEDVGGPPGYEHCLKAIQDPEYESHEEMLEWCGGGFDPADFDLSSVNRKLKRFRL